MVDAERTELELVKRHRWRMLSTGVALNELERLCAANTWDEWLDLWTQTGERYEGLGDEAARRGRWVTAGSHWASAALYYHFAQFLFYGDLRRKQAAERKKFAVYEKAAPHLVPPAERIAVPFGPVTVFGYLRRPLDASGRVPCVLLVPGLEATKEELRALEDVFLVRGMATFSFDGPGQGECWPQKPLDERYHEAVTACVDHLVARSDVDPSRLAIMGLSLGGLLAPLAAAHEPRLRACAELGGSFDMDSRWDRANVLSRRGYQHVTHARDEAEARTRAARLTLAPVARRLTVPTLVVHGAQDRIVPPEQAYMFKEQVPNVEFLIFEDGNHVCQNLAHIVRPLIADWIAEKLA